MYLCLFLYKIKKYQVYDNGRFKIYRYILFTDDKEVIFYVTQLALIKQLA